MRHEVQTPRQLSIVVVERNQTYADLITSALEGSLDSGSIEQVRSIEEALALTKSDCPRMLLVGSTCATRHGLDLILNSQAGISTALIFGNKEELNGHAGQAAINVRFLAENLSWENLLQAVNEVCGGRAIRSHGSVAVPKMLIKDSADGDVLAPLSKREKEVFYLLADGVPNRVIAKQLFVSPRTIETHRARVIKKLGLKSTAGIIKYAIKNNLLAP